jgi:hypothetical protein
VKVEHAFSNRLINYNQSPGAKGARKRLVVSRLARWPGSGSAQLSLSLGKLLSTTVVTSYSIKAAGGLPNDTIVARVHRAVVHRRSFESSGPFLFLIYPELRCGPRSETKKRSDSLHSLPSYGDGDGDGDN